jgi:hypothetical protein
MKIRWYFYAAPTLWGKKRFQSVGTNTLRYGRNLKCWEVKVLGDFVKKLTKKFFKKSIDK